MKCPGNPVQMQVGQRLFPSTRSCHAVSASPTGSIPWCSQPEMGFGGLSTFQVLVNQILKPVINLQKQKLALKHPCYSPGR